MLHLLNKMLRPFINWKG